MTTSSVDVLIVGAGIAGLISARTLADRGLRVCVIETHDRVGGRILTTRVGGEVIELGAEFVHGRPPELLALIDEAGLALAERTGTQMHFDGTRLHSSDDEDGPTSGPLERLRGFSGADISFQQYLHRDESSLDEQERAQALGYVEGFNAADANEISARSLGVQQLAEEAIEGDRIAHLSEGYDRLPAFVAERVFAAGGEIRCGISVLAVRWRAGHVTVETTQGELVAPRVVLTLPLGVLQAGRVPITPAPHAVLAAASQMRVGHVSRFTVLFRKPSWQRPGSALQELSFLLSPGELPPVWWTSHPEPARTLTGWAGGPRAQVLLHETEEQLANRAVTALGRILGEPEARLRDQIEACRTHDWSADPASLGAYSYVGVGGVDASARMAEPVEDTLFFAGEHTDTTGHWGTVHGAMRSGLRVAEQILARMHAGR